MWPKRSPFTAGAGVPCQPLGGCREDPAERESLSCETQALPTGQGLFPAKGLGPSRELGPTPPARLRCGCRRPPHTSRNTTQDRKAPCGRVGQAHGPQPSTRHWTVLEDSRRDSACPRPRETLLSVWAWPVTCQGDSRGHKSSILRG